MYLIKVKTELCGTMAPQEQDWILDLVILPSYHETAGEQTASDPSSITEISAGIQTCERVCMYHMS